MMFKPATVLAVMAALVSGSQAAALDSRQNTPGVCPLQANQQFCGWYLENIRQCPGARIADLNALNPNSNINSYNAIYETDENGIPVRFIAECRDQGCDDSHSDPNLPVTTCTTGVIFPPSK